MALTTMCVITRLTIPDFKTWTRSLSVSRSDLYSELENTGFPAAKSWDRNEIYDKRFSRILTLCGVSDILFSEDQVSYLGD